jgi:hypothetical protein
LHFKSNPKQIADHGVFRVGDHWRSNTKSSGDNFHKKSLTKDFSYLSHQMYALPSALA